jgi:hypothetical protein
MRFADPYSLISRVMSGPKINWSSYTVFLDRSLTGPVKDAEIFFEPTKPLIEILDVCSRMLESALCRQIVIDQHSNRFAAQAFPEKLRVKIGRIPDRSTK